MRLTIATKLFFGFLCVIGLNAFFFVVVNKMGTVIDIVSILKRQNEVKNSFIKLKTWHRIQGPSILSYYKIGRQESIQNFKGMNHSIVHLIDSIQLRIDSIMDTDARLVSGDRNVRNKTAMKKILEKLNDINAKNSNYASFFEKLVKIRGTASSSAQQTEKYRLSFLDTLNIIESLISADLDSAEAMINEHTNTRIKDIGGEITDVKGATILILGGITLFAIIFGLIFSRTITNSLRHLKESATQIGKADFNINPQGYHNDEIGDLATAFFDMALDLRNKQEELIRSKRLAAIGEVIASVNHEINNPLMIISGNAQFLEMSMEAYPEEVKERIRTILEETERISRVTRKLREIKNPVTEDYTSSGEQMINLDKSTR